jgi:hypothetical protein
MTPMLMRDAIVMALGYSLLTGFLALIVGCMLGRYARERSRLGRIVDWLVNEAREEPRQVVASWERDDADAVAERWSGSNGEA